MAMTHPTQPGIRTLGDLPEGVEHVSGPVGRVMETLSEGVHTRPVTFWLIWSKGAPHNPRFSHHTLEHAQAEARRLARKHPSRRWFVVQAIERVWVNEAEDRAETPDADERAA